MQYGQLISRPLSIMWRHRYLWLLAILGGGDVGATYGSGSFRFPSGTGTGFPGGAPAPQVSQFLQANLGLIVGAAVILLLLALAWFVLSCVTTGALVRASAEHDAERPFRFGPAWRAGLGTFWSILGLRLLGLVVGLVAIAVIGLLVLLGFLSYSGGQPGLLALVVVVGIVVVLALIPVAIAVGIVFILATRSVVLEQRGAIAALGRALRLFRDRLGRNLLVWLLQVGLAIGVGVAMFILFLIVFAVLLIPLVAAGAVGGPGAAALVGVPVGLVVLAGLVLLGGMTSAYFSTYWTLAFRRLELDVPRPAPYWPPGGYYPPQPPPGGYYPPQPPPGGYYPPQPPPR